MIFTKNQKQILAILLSQPGKEYYLSELGRILDKFPGVFLKGVNALERQGVILSRKRGNQRLLKINCEHPLFKEIKGIVQKTEGVKGLLGKLVSEIKDISIAIIYGTYAKDALRPDSDIDLLVVADAEKAEDILLDKLADMEQKVQREINYKIYSRIDFSVKIKEKDPFITEILSGKYILLKGVL
ncbi:MAG: nucleotidyltransferase domain-containing protein [Candidatus Omnitrophota bacterium]